ncbi:MAG: hypothetical protein R3B35_03975 [Gemmatimonadales bacterium]
MPRPIFLLALTLALAAPLPAQDGSPTAVLDRGIARMGGDSLLRTVHALRLDVLTQWLRTEFGEAPFQDAPSLERNVELRDYASGAWRNSRYFSLDATAPGLVVVVDDTIATMGRVMQRDDPTLTWGPLNIAYVDERRELFAFAPERLLLTLRDDPTRRALPDTILDGVRHVRLAAVVDGWPSVTFLSRQTGLPTLVRFRADEVNDFGLAPWGEHEVEFWYTGWRPVAPGVLLPRQRDVRRVGRPYKRMTVLSAAVNPPLGADSFAVADSVRAAYLATARAPMWDVPLEGGARLVDGDFAVMPGFTGSAGAVRVGGEWVVFETGQAAGAMAAVAAWLGQQDAATPIGAGFATSVRTGNGGAPWFGTAHRPVYAGPAAARLLDHVPGAAAAVTPIREARWLRIGSDSVWVEPVSGPDLDGALAVYVPTLEWLWSPFSASPFHGPEQQALVARLAERGFAVRRTGGPGALLTPAR